MKTLVSIVSFILVAITVHTLSCKKKNGTQPNTVVLPYPSVADQRTSLAGKLRVSPVRILDSASIIQDLEYLASDICEGRAPGTAGHALAKNRILGRIRMIGLDSFDQSTVQAFTGSVVNGTIMGQNLVGWVKGTIHPDTFIVVTAHYDHLGKNENGEIYNGADDNATGVACLLGLAGYFKQHPHPYSLVFAAMDREETGMEGAYHFVPLFEKSRGAGRIKFNLNLDMIGRNEQHEIFACGIRHYPSFMYLVREVQNRTNAKLLMGHDSGDPANDWTTLSDHAAFYKKNIPFLYLGVEDHADYHEPTDDFNKIPYSNYIENCNMVAVMIQLLHF